MKTFEDQFLKVLQQANRQIIVAAGKVDEMALAVGMKQEVVRILEEAGYGKVVGKFLAEEKNIVKREIAAMAGRPIPMQFAQADVAQIQALQSKELMNLMNLKTGMARDIQEITAQGVMTNMSDGQLAKQIGDITDVQSRHITTYLRTARNQYIQKLHDISGARYEERTGEEVFWKYIGPFDNITRDECRRALRKKYFTTEEKSKFQSGAILGAAVPRWNCRHSFIEVTKREYDKH